MSGLWQYLVVYTILLWCLWRLARKYAPDFCWRWQAKVSYFFESSDNTTFKHLGRRLRPAISIPTGCANHCRTCNTCA